ncbi:MAG: hypothetical protein GF418_13740 [Chitinivibrionales bacterium]|nr:hypothetical protein [Chitinivibrionales bacterium]MBD3396683.1 hypothetical protein [Chitinivibrionales bacterium]
MRTAAAFACLMSLAVVPSAPGEPEMALRDTAAYTNDIYADRFSRFYFNDSLVDSIDTDFGLQPVGRDSVVYVRVETLDRRQLRGTYFTKLMLFHDGAVSRLSRHLPFYNEHFSSPAVIDSTLYYWGFHEDKVLAARMDFDAGRPDTITLDIHGSMITDSPFFFARPKRHAGGVLFGIADGQSFVVSPDLDMVREVVSDTLVSPGTR